MNILLINPPRSPHNAIFDHAPPEAKPFVHRNLVGPPLGLLTVAGSVREHNVTLLELKAIYDSDPDAPSPETQVRRAVAQTDPGIVGVTVIASEVPAALAILRTVKALSPDILTVAGGLHATLAPKDLFDPAVDVVFPGPAVPGFRDLVAALQAGKPFDTVRGMWISRNGRWGSTGTPAVRTQPAGKDFVMPDRTLVRPWLSAYVVGNAPGPSTYLYTSLGCPHRCSFCSIWPQYRGRYLKRRVESVIRELRTLDAYPVVRFADANTLGDVAFVRTLCRRMEEEGMDKTLVADVRADTVVAYPDVMERLARVGLKVVIVGFESPWQHEVDHYQKRMSVSSIEEAVRILHGNGILIRGNYMVPPDYDAPAFDALASFAERNRVGLAGYTILTPMPGTPFHREVRNRIVDHDLAKYNLFNCVLASRLDRDEFHARVGALWRIREGTQTI